MDRVAKYAVYARAGIAEYWIVKPDAKSVEVFVLEKENIAHQAFLADDKQCRLVSRQFFLCL